MIQCGNHGFSYIGVPKTASLSTRDALFPYATFLSSSSLEEEHMSYSDYLSKFKDEYDVVAVVREPLEWLKSFHRYLADPIWNVPTMYRTDVIYLNDYVKKYMKGKKVFPEPYHFQHEYVTCGDKIVNYLFKYENLDKFEKFLSDRLKTKIVLPKKNVSPKRKTEHILQKETIEAFKEYAKKDYEIYKIAE